VRIPLSKFRPPEKLTFFQSLTLKDAETLVLKTLKQVMEEKLDSKNVQLASVTKAGFRIYPDTEMAEVVARLANA
jgi:20S proteasome subunit alpha 5